MANALGPDRCVTMQCIMPSLVVTRCHILLRSFHLQVNEGGTGMVMTAGKYARQLFLKQHKLVVNYCAVAAIKVA